ncbi:MAG: Gfo/Idh/MocA family oxidoreductase [Candidatus Uhrbacteria bacterium]
MYSKTIRPIRIGIIGCGGIVQTMHIPALCNLSHVAVTWLVDPNAANRNECARWFPEAAHADDLEAIDDVDAALIATPPGLHYDHITYALQRGWHVLTEKPLTTNEEHASDVVALAKRAGKYLCVNVNRRFLTQIPVLREVLRAERFGRVQHMQLFDGGRCTGGPVSGSSFHSSSQLAGGGVMLDTGSHVLDLALYLLGDVEVRTVDYSDDGATGLEAECRFALQATNAQHGDLKLEGLFSRLAPVGQRIVVQCERARLVVNFPSGDIEVHEKQHEDVPLIIRVDHSDDPVGASFLASWEEFVGRIRDTRARPIHHAESVLPALRIMRRCYRERQPLKNPWDVVPQAADAARQRRQATVVGVVGAGGFLGSRLYERLLDDERFIPRAITHSSLGSFAITRYDTDVRIGDAQDPVFLREALRGVDVVVNCAINMRGARRFAIKTTRAIARNIARAAHEVGAKRLVHISTIAVHGVFLGCEGEASRYDPDRSTYAVAKRASERDVLRASRRWGVDSVVLRMGHIYGPYSAGWTAGQRDLVRAGSIIRAASWAYPSNTVFVDNAIDAIIAASVCSSQLHGTTLYITDLPNKSWKEFYEPLFVSEQQAMDNLPNLTESEVERIRCVNHRGVVRQVVGCVRALVQPVFSKQHLRSIRDRRAFLRLFNLVESIVPERGFQLFKRWIRERSGPYVGKEQGRSVDGLRYDMACVYASNIRFPVEDAVSAIGYSPSYSWEEANRISLRWLHALESTCREK